MRSSLKLAAELSTTCVAPRALRPSTCSGLLTMFTSGIFSCTQTRTSMRPSCEAAAVCTMPMWCSRRIFSTMPRTVMGFTKEEAACLGVTPSGCSWTSSILRHCTSVYVKPWTKTVLPRRCLACSPASSTTPAPSLPMPPHSPSCSPTSVPSGRGMSTKSRPDLSVQFTASSSLSLPKYMPPRSEGLMGAPPMRTTTWSASGFGTGILKTV
mmetsp:Transcript_25260/g.79702  ORF Transcript_25260/g.79702 Transcript_25260/m.79702 type:complete len:211 (+) Transcript_25260:519-1151(+)